MNAEAHSSPSRWMTVGLALGLAAGVGGTYLITRKPPASATAAPPSAPAPKYHCPMHPSYTSDRPGECPVCGMTLEPLEENAPSGSGVLRIDPQRQQLMGLRTAPVEFGEVGMELRLPGRVAIDETRVRRVNVKVEGFVERLYADFVGKPVAKGQPLFSLYGPELLSAQRELLLAARTRDALAKGELRERGEQLVDSARRRLRLWDVPDSALEQVLRTGEPLRALTFHSPIAGVITAKNVVEGARLAPGDTPLEITDLGQVWVLADAQESDLPRVRPGAPVRFELKAGGRAYQGRVAFVDPVMDPKSRTARLRLGLPNPAGDLKPEMFGEAVIQVSTRRGLWIPSDAVLDAGVRKVVFVALRDGKFEPREVRIGVMSRDRSEVLDGLEAGEAVVVRAAFLVDSESRLRAALAGLAGKPSDPHAGHGR